MLQQIAWSMRMMLLEWWRWLSCYCSGETPPSVSIYRFKIFQYLWRCLAEVGMGAAMPAVMDLPVDIRDTVLTNMPGSGRGSWKLPGGTILELSWTLPQSLLPKLFPSRGLKRGFHEYQNLFKKDWCSGPSPRRRGTSGCTLVPVAAPPMPWSTRTLLSVRDSDFWSKELSVEFFKSVSTFPFYIFN